MEGAKKGRTNMTFMEPEITDHTEWLAIDGTHGITYIPKGALTNAELASALADDYTGIAPYYEGACIYSVEIISGYGARLSAPGYMDCTDWTVFDTYPEAEEYLKEYMDEEEGC